MQHEIAVPDVCGFISDAGLYGNVVIFNLLK